ncbi:MAG: NAD(P) transhydrogenase subunit alpha [Pirellulales bacterium]|nr:NAD(P) transhydrogenase subunit alpha [Pirellulales bacterium]
MPDILLMVSVFVISFIVGYLLISSVPARLHTPLMSLTNAISAVTILGGILLFATETTTAEKLLGASAIALAAFNVVGGFTITDRMVKMFHRKQPNS